MQRYLLIITLLSVLLVGTTSCNSTDANELENYNGIYTGKLIGFQGTFPVVVYEYTSRSFLIEANWSGTIQNRTVRAAINNGVISLNSFVDINNLINGTGKFTGDSIELSYRVDNSDTYTLVASRDH